MLEDRSNGKQLPIGAAGPPPAPIKLPMRPAMQPSVAGWLPPEPPPPRPRPLPVRGRQLWVMLAGIAVGTAAAAFGFAALFGRSIETRQRSRAEADLREAIALEDRDEESEQAVALYKKALADTKTRPLALRHLMGNLLDNFDQTRQRSRRLLDAAEPDWPHTAEAQEATELFIRRLRAGDRETRPAAANVLAILADRRAIPALIDALTDESADRAAAEALQQIDPNWYLTPEAAGCVPALLRALTSSSEYGRSAACTALTYCGNASLICPIVEACAYDSINAETAVQMLSSIDPSWTRRAEAGKAAEICLARLRQPLRYAPLNAVTLLAAIGDRRAVPPLIRILARELDVDVDEKAALAALERIDPDWRQSEAAAALLPDLRRHLRHHDQYVREDAAAMLYEIGGLAACVDALKDENVQARQQMARFLFANELTTEAILLLAHPDEAVRGIARARLADHSLYGLRGERTAMAATAALIPALKNPAVDARDNAAWAIVCMSGSGELRAALEPLRSGGDPQVSRYAEDLLKKYAPKGP